MIIKKLREKLNKIKICAVLTAICFMISTLGANLYAIPVTDNSNQKYEDVFNKEYREFRCSVVSLTGLNGMP